MLVLLTNPGLPRGRVSELMLGSKYQYLLEGSLNKLGIKIIPFPKNTSLPDALSGHVDLSVLHLGGPKLIVSKNIVLENPLLVNYLTNRGLDVIPSYENTGDRYPYDCILNACIISGYLIHHQSDKSILDQAELTQIVVKQGYTRCSTCVVDSSSFITSDAGICSAATSNGFDVLLIEPGHIELSGYDTGFIGGASFKITNDAIGFTGRLDHHPSCGNILDFLGKKSVRPVFLTDRPIFDIGSAILLTEVD